MTLKQRRMRQIALLRKQRGDRRKVRGPVMAYPGMAPLAFSAGPARNLEGKSGTLSTRQVREDGTLVAKIRQYVPQGRTKLGKGAK
jgi:hypothetical protein